MILLFSAIRRFGKRFSLLAITFTFMLLSTGASQMEAFVFGAITKSGPDVFTLFGPEKTSKTDFVTEVSKEQLDQRFSEITDDGQTLTKRDVTRYMAKRKGNNPINRMMNWMVGPADFLRNLKVLAVVIIIVALIKGITLFGSGYTHSLVMTTVTRDLRQEYFEHLQKMSLNFYAKYNVGSLTTRASVDASAVADAIYAALTAYLQTPITIISSLVLCCIVSWELSIVMFIGFPLVLAPMFWLAKRIKRLSRKILWNSETYAAALIDCLSGIQTIKLFAMEKYSIKKFKEQNDKLAALSLKSARYGLLSRPVLHMVSTLMLSGIILYGLYFAQMQVSEILVFCLLVYFMYQPLKRLSDEHLKIQAGIAAIERFYEVFDMQPEQEDVADAVPLTEFKEKIEFKDVYFRYQEDWVLKGVSFTLEKGKVVAFVGSTGAGKTTLAHLLPRLYDPQEGEILIDGQPIRSFQQHTLRQQIAFVPQKPFLFLDTVAENISFGQDYTREEIVTAAKRAHAHEFIEALPRGYDSNINEGGKNFSGGQLQRLAIARALVKKSPILVMDEATSSLDAISEDRIKQAINELRGEVTQVLIAHRLSTIEHADNIIFLEQGKILAQGTKDELCQTCPQFRTMWDLMHGGVEV